MKTATNDEVTGTALAVRKPAADAPTNLVVLPYPPGKTVRMTDRESVQARAWDRQRASLKRDYSHLPREVRAILLEVAKENFRAGVEAQSDALQPEILESELRLAKLSKKYHDLHALATRMQENARKRAGVVV